MVVGKDRVLREAAPVKLQVAHGAGRRPALRGRRAATPLAALAGTRLSCGCATTAPAGAAARRRRRSS